MPRPSRPRVRLLAGLATAAIGLAHAAPARADDGDPSGASDPRTTRVLLAGAALEILPFAVGGTMVADSGNQTVRRASVYLASAGFTLAPLVAHGLADEWGRGAAFASVPFACGVGLAVLMQQPSGDVLVEEGTKGTRIPFWILASAALAASAAGVIDAAIASSHASQAPRRHAFYVVPGRVPSGASLNLGGAF